MNSHGHAMNETNPSQINLKFEFPIQLFKTQDFATTAINSYFYPLFPRLPWEIPGVFRCTRPPPTGPRPCTSWTTWRRNGCGPTWSCDRRRSGPARGCAHGWEGECRSGYSMVFLLLYYHDVINMMFISCFSQYMILLFYRSKTLSSWLYRRITL